MLDGVNIQGQVWGGCVLWRIDGCKTQTPSLSVRGTIAPPPSPPNECCDGLSHCKSQNTQWILMLAPPLAWGNIHGCSRAQRHPKAPVSNTICSKHLSSRLTLFVCRNQSITLWAVAQISDQISTEHQRTQSFHLFCRASKWNRNNMGSSHGLKGGHGSIRTHITRVHLALTYPVTHLGLLECEEPPLAQRNLQVALVWVLAADPRRCSKCCQSAPVVLHGWERQDSRADFSVFSYTGEGSACQHTSTQWHLKAVDFLSITASCLSIFFVCLFCFILVFFGSACENILLSKETNLKRA